MLLTILSGLFGGFLRLAPEVLKYLDAKQDRAHEALMQDKALAFQQLTGTQKIAEITAQGQIDTQKAQFDAYQSAFASQSAMSVAGGKVMSAISAFVRPSVTFFVFCMWAAWKICTFYMALKGSGIQGLMASWTDDDTSMMTMIISFWFCGRAIEKNS